MAKRRQPERWESGMLAAVLAVSGTVFLFDKLGSLVKTGLITFNGVLHIAPVFLVAMAVSLMLAESDPNGERSSPRRSMESRYE